MRSVPGSKVHSAYESASPSALDHLNSQPRNDGAGYPGLISFRGGGTKAVCDYVGFGASSAFGGPCNTSVAERLATNGLKHNRFHMTALCSPTRAALLTGRNHHTVGMAGITEIATAAPGYPSLILNSCAPLEGTSMRPSFDQANAPEARTTQYFEMFVNRGIYHQGSTALTRHSTPWALDQAPPPTEDDVWELYGPDDWTQSHDLAHEMPDKLAELQTLFIIEAARYNVLPLDDRRVERVSAALAGRPTLIRGNTQLLFAAMGSLSEHSVIDIKNRSHSITAQVAVPDDGADSVIITQRGAFGGWTIYLLDGKPADCYNLFGAQRFKAYSETAIEPGEHQIRVEFDYDGGGYGKGGTATLFSTAKRSAR